MLVTKATIEEYIYCFSVNECIAYVWVHLESVCQGRIAKAMRTVVKAAATRENTKVTVEII